MLPENKNISVVGREAAMKKDSIDNIDASATAVVTDSSSSSASAASAAGKPKAAKDSSHSPRAPLLSKEFSSIVQRQQFPWKLHQVLDEAEERGYSDIICWAPNGKSFQIISKKRFEEKVMPLVFSSNKFKRFQRYET